MTDLGILHVFWLSLGLLLYAYAGYPVLVWMLERVFYRPVRKEPFAPEVTVIVTAHNEAEVLSARIENLLALDYPADRLRIVIASDGSTDGTAAVAARFAERGVILREHPVRRGKAAVLNDEVAECKTEFVVLADARQRFEPGALRALMANFADLEVGCASGLLVLSAPEREGIGRGMGFYWRYETFIRRCESGIHSTVGATGALLAFRRTLWKGLPAQTIVDDMVLPFQAVRQGYRVVLEEEAVVHDRPSDSWEREFARKTRTLSGNFQILFHPFRMAAPLFSVLTLQWLSHKVMRLLGPLLLVLLFWSGYWLYRYSLHEGDERAAAFHGAFLLLQGVLYLSAAAGFAAERLRIRLPLVHIPYSFLLTQVAICCGFLRWGSGRDDAIWEKTYSAEAGGLHQRLIRLFADSTLFCFGIILAFYVRYGGSPPGSVFQLFSKLNPHFEFGGWTLVIPFGPEWALGTLRLAVPLVILVPLTVFYFFRVNERKTSEVDPEFILTIVHGVFFSTLVMVLLIYKMRDTLTAMHEGLMVGFPTLVLILSFFLNCLLLSAWRLAWKWFRYSALASEGAWRDVLLAGGEPPDPEAVVAIETDPRMPTRAAGFIGPPGGAGMPHLATVGEVEKAFTVVRADSLLVAAGTLSEPQTLRLLDAADHHGVEAGILPGDADLLFATAQLRLIRYIPVLSGLPERLSESTALFKRGGDFAAGLLLLLLGAPAACVAWLGHGRRLPVVGLTRYGRGGIPFVRYRAARFRRGGEPWWRRGLNRALCGWHLLRGDLAVVGPPALSRRSFAHASALETTFLAFRPGLFGPRHILLSGRTRIRPAFRPALFYAHCFRLGLDMVYLGAVLLRIWQRTSLRLGLSRTKQ